MEKQLEIESILRRALDAEMAIRSLTTKIQHIREAIAEIEEFKKAYNNIRLDNFFKKESMAIEVEALEKEKRIKDVIDALEYILAQKTIHYKDKINEELETVNSAVSRLPKSVNLSVLLPMQK
jgi:hypothetical protein